MLSSILPGLRQLRAPFIAGAILAASFYLLFRGPILHLAQSGSQVAGIQDIVTLLGAEGLLAVASLIAYLLGNVFVELVLAIHMAFDRRTLKAEWYVKNREAMNAKYFLLAPYTHASRNRIDLRCGLDSALADAVSDEILTSRGKRLISTHDNLYAEFDRLRSEVELRLTLVVSSLLLLVTMSFVLDWSVMAKIVLCVVTLVILLGLLIHAQAINRDSNSMLAHWVADRTMSTASLDFPVPSTNDQERFTAILRELPLKEGVLDILENQFSSRRWAAELPVQLGNFVEKWGEESFNDPVVEAKFRELVDCSSDLCDWCENEEGDFGGEPHNRWRFLKSAELRGEGGESSYREAIDEGKRLRIQVLELRRSFERVCRLRGFYVPIAGEAALPDFDGR